MTTDIEAAHDKWHDEVSPFWDSGGEPGVVRLAFEAGWLARGRHDVDATALLLEEHDHLVLSRDDMATGAFSKGRVWTPDELTMDESYGQRIKDINRWLDGTKGRTGADDMTTEEKGLHDANR